MIYKWEYKFELQWDQVKCNKGVCNLPRTHKFIILKIDSILPFIHIEKGLQTENIRINILDKGEYEKWVQID